MTTYRVVAALKYPSVYDQGTELVIADVRNKKEAISEARAIVRRDALYDRHDGPIEYSAVQIEDQVPVFDAPEPKSEPEAVEVLDPRIGILMREGKHVYYAFVDGQYVENANAAIVMAAL